jgi:hypothetical protein
MIKKVLIGLFLMMAINMNAQTYFNFRFEFENPGIWDGATNVLILPDG